MADPFVHLHVASGYSMRYGASHPHVLVERAAEHGMDALALTDRDGLYGAVKFALACHSAGIRPLLGVDLAVEPTVLLASAGAGRAGRASGAGRTGRSLPARGGAFLADGHPRVTLLAQGRAGWAGLCRLVSTTHLRGERGAPVTTLDLVAEQVEAADGHLLVLLGPGSELGRALRRRRVDLALHHLQQWRAVVPGGDLLVEVVNHRGPGQAAEAGRLAGFAVEQGIPAVLTNAVRYADRSDAPTADVLDAARRLVVLDPRHVDRVNAEGGLKSGKEMALVAEEVARAAGLSDHRELLARTRGVADRCALDPRADLGIGEVHFPELAMSESARAAGGTRLAGGGASEADALLRERCVAGLHRRGLRTEPDTMDRLSDELAVIRTLGYPTYFHTVADVVELIRSMGIRCAARGSGAGSLVTYLLGISDVDPLEHSLLMERFLSPLRRALPDIDVDVESARRTEIYEAVLARYGGERCVCVSMMDTYRVRHAVRDVGAALGMPPGEVDAIAKAFPHIAARQARAALRDLPELRSSGITEERLGLMLRLVERLDGLPRHIALHPCGVLLSDLTLLDRTPVESSWLGFPMSQFDKDDVEELGLLKLDVLGVRMQSAMAHAVVEVARVEGATVDLDRVPRDDPAAFALIQSTRTLGCFQIESPGQRELIGKFAPETFADLVVDISLFRPGPVKSDMVEPFLAARHGWREPVYPHPDFEPALAETFGVVVFHEQVLRLVATATGCSLAEADEVRRRLGDREGQEEIKVWFCAAATRQGYDTPTTLRLWEILAAFASFGFCKAHAAAFALPTYQSAWLKAHHPAAFLAGVLTHDPGMYPKRLILEDARQLGIAVLGLDVNQSAADYRVERVGVLDEPPPEILGQRGSRPAPPAGLPDGRGQGIRLALAEVRGISAAEVASITAHRPYSTLADFWHRAQVSRPVVERLVVAGAFDSLYGIGATAPVRRRGQVTRRDLLLQVAELHQWSSSVRRSARPAPSARTGLTGPRSVREGPGSTGPLSVRERSARQSQAPRAVVPVDAQLALDLGDDPREAVASGLPEMTVREQVQAELDVLGLDATHHVLAAYEPFLTALRVTRAADLLSCRSQQDILVAGVKVATQTPAVRSGRRVVFVTLDDATGPVDATFFEDVQPWCASTVFGGWLLVVRGLVRRTGPRGLSLRAVAAWDLPSLRDAWVDGGVVGLRTAMAPAQAAADAAIEAKRRGGKAAPPEWVDPAALEPAQEPILVHASGFRQSAYADIKPAGGDAASAPRRLWHASPGSSGR